MKNKNTWTPEKAREMAKKSAMMRKMKKENLAYLGLESQRSHGEPIKRLIAFPSPNFAMPNKKIFTMEIIFDWISLIGISVLVGIMTGMGLIVIDKLIN